MHVLHRVILHVRHRGHVMKPSILENAEKRSALLLLGLAAQFCSVAASML